MSYIIHVSSQATHMWLCDQYICILPLFLKSGPLWLFLNDFCKSCFIKPLSNLELGGRTKRNDRYWDLLIMLSTSPTWCPTPVPSLPSSTSKGCRSLYVRSLRPSAQLSHRPSSESFSPWFPAKASQPKHFGTTLSLLWHQTLTCFPWCVAPQSLSLPSRASPKFRSFYRNCGVRQCAFSCTGKRGRTWWPNCRLKSTLLRLISCLGQIFRSESTISKV